MAAWIIFFCVFSCSKSDQRQSGSNITSAETAPVDPDSDGGTHSSQNGGSNRGEEMALISPAGAAPFYIDQYEAMLEGTVAHSVIAKIPKVSINYADAKIACEAAGKRMCRLKEWQTACKGPEILLFGFQANPNTPMPIIEICDVSRSRNNTPGSMPSASGSHPNCKTKGYDVYDMIGNATEWVIREDNVPVAAGAAFYQSPEQSNCDAGLSDPGTASMDPTEMSTDLGFRCCKNSE